MGVESTAGMVVRAAAGAGISLDMSKRFECAGLFGSAQAVYQSAKIMCDRQHRHGSSRESRPALRMATGMAAKTRSDERDDEPLLGPAGDLAGPLGAVGADLQLEAVWDIEGRAQRQLGAVFP